MVMLSSLRSVASWFSLTLASFSIGLLVYIRLVWRFEDFETPHFLAGGAFLLAAAALLISLAGLPKWKSIAAIVLVAIAAFLFGFTQLFCCEV